MSPRRSANIIGRKVLPTAIPTEPVAIAVALADKFDTLVGFFAIDERPTGSKDPYALRRAALGIIRLILENALRLPHPFPNRAGLRQLSAARRGDAGKRAFRDKS